MRRNLTLIYIFNFLIDFRFYAPIAILYFAEVSGSYTLGMSVFSVIFVSQAFFEIPTGLYSDRIGRRATMILGSLLSLGAVCLYATGYHYAFLLVAAILEGGARACFSGTTSALLWDSLSSLNREKEFSTYKGKTSSMFKIALLGAAGIGGIVASAHSLQMVVIASIFPQMLCVYVTYLLIEPPNQKKTEHNLLEDFISAIKYLIQRPKLRVLALANIVTFASGQATNQLETAFYNAILPLWLVGIAKMLGYACAGLSFWFSGKLIRAVGHYKALMASHSLIWVMGVFAVVMNIILSPFILAVSSLANGIKYVANSDLLNNEFTKDQRATMGSLVSFVGSISFAMVSLLAGLIVDLSNIYWAMIFILSLNLISLILYSVMKPMKL